MFLKQLFCSHTFVVKEAKFITGRSIPPEASLGLTSKTRWIYSSTSFYNAPYTIINTHYVIKGDYIYLYVKQCVFCGKVLPCDAFEAQEKEREHDILRSEGF